MNTYNFDVNFTTGRIYAPDFILVVNDHNSTLFKFTFDQTGRYVFKLLYPDGTIYVQDIMDNQLKLTKGVLNQEGNYKFEISLYGEDNRLTTARIKEFPVRLELVSTDEPVQADDRLPILDNLIEETNKVVEAAKNGEFDGATFTPSVSDNGDLSWTNDKGKENPPTVNIAGPPGAPGAVKMQVVDTLPDTGETDTIYLLKKDTPGEQNLYDEYVYTETSGWEHIGDTSVDLTDYYTKVETDERLNNKQDTLTAGDNITIENNVISAKDGALPLVVLPARSISDVSANDYEGRRIDILSLVKDQIEYAIDNFDGCCLLLFGGDDSSTNRAYPPYTYLLRPSFMYSKKQTRYEWQMTYTSTSIPLNSNELYGNKRIVISAQGTWNGNKFTCTSCNYNRESAWSYLYINNTKPYTPTNDYNPATKKYVDDNKYTLPVASAETLGGIKLGEGLSADENGVVSAQVGETIPYTYAEYGFFSGIARQITDTVFIANVENLITKYLNKSKTVKRIGAFSDTQSTNTSPIYMTYSCYNKITTSMTSFTFYGDTSSCMNYNDKYQIVSSVITVSGTWNDNQFHITTCNIKGVPNGTVIATSSTALLKNNTTSFTPTGDYNPSTKLYTDKTHYENMTGYDATKTQVLKNVNGTLTWVDEG